VQVFDRLAVGERALAWRFDPAIAGAGLFLDLASHCFDLLDFLIGRIAAVSGFAINSGGAYAAEDVTGAAFQFGSGVAGTGIWNFNADRTVDGIRITGSAGELMTPVFVDGDVVVTRAGQEEIYPVRNPSHVHQPLIQTIVNELQGQGRCESTGESGARASWAMDRCLEGYYTKEKGPAVARRPESAI
jgi:predicted dehydrogenase